MQRRGQRYLIEVVCPHLVDAGDPHPAAIITRGWLPWTRNVWRCSACGAKIGEATRHYVFRKVCHDPRVTDIG